jgi:hypothetical protein
MVVLLASSLELGADDREAACAWNSSAGTDPPQRASAVIDAGVGGWLGELWP